MGTPQDPTEAGGPPAPSHPHAFGGKSAEGTPPSLCPHGEAQYGAGWVLGQGMMLDPACRELVLGTNTGCWAPIPGAAADCRVLGQRWVQRARRWVLVQSTGCWVHVVGAGIGIMVLGRVPVWDYGAG